RPPGADTFVHRVCSYWLQRLDTEDRARTAQQTAMVPWVDTEAQARLQLEHALVQLWIDPERAATALDGLARPPRVDAPDDAAPPLRSEIEQRLGVFAVSGDPDRIEDERTVVLPWRWSALSAGAQLRLWSLGLGRSTLGSPRRVRPSPPTLLGIGL